MPFYYYFDPMYYLFALPGLLIALYAQAKVKSNYSKYSRVQNSAGVTGADIAREILNQNGIYNVDIRRIKGNLTDNYNPRDNAIYLSDGVFGSNTVAAIGVAAHEAGHAVQHAVGYTPIKIRSALVPVCNFGAGISPFLLILGYVLNFAPLLYIALAVFSLSVIFQLVTLPVEFNASRRALAAIEGIGRFNDYELKGAKKVLSAAALTYVAALMQSILMFLYYALRILGSGNRRD
ncbi:MAG: zinc metallopeptidase [Acutalibacteraceae bacterium]|nr:zinc metallopeptidase [Acutalibacteraceae bacterium]